MFDPDSERAISEHATACNPFWGDEITLCRLGKADNYTVIN